MQGCDRRSKNAYGRSYALARFDGVCSGARRTRKQVWNAAWRDCGRAHRRMMVARHEDWGDLGQWQLDGLRVVFLERTCRGGNNPGAKLLPGKDYFPSADAWLNFGERDLKQGLVPCDPSQSSAQQLGPPWQHSIQGDRQEISFWIECFGIFDGRSILGKDLQLG